MLRSENGGAGRLQVLVVGGNGLDLFWLEMVLKGSRLPYCIEAVADGHTAVEYLARRAMPQLVLVDGPEIAAQLPPIKPLFVLEKPFTHAKLFDCLAKADLSAWAASVVPV